MIYSVVVSLDVVVFAVDSVGVLVVAGAEVLVEALLLEVPLAVPLVVDEVPEEVFDEALSDE